jgi:hypothetical protein
MGQPIAVSADEGENPPGRIASTRTSNAQYQWWLVYWADHSLACDFSINHEGQPSDQEIQSKCSSDLYTLWKSSITCNSSGISGTPSCKGLYLYAVNPLVQDEVITVHAAPPVIWISLDGCNAIESDAPCVGNPSMTFTGEEPIQGHRISQIYGKIGSYIFKCESNVCSVPLRETDLQGEEFTFQGDSSFGDSTQEFIGYIRVIPDTPLKGSYSIDVISTQFRGKKPPSCSSAWEVFPENVTPPDWLKTPGDAAELQRSTKLYYLAASLIKNGIVDADVCDRGGLVNDTVANECGVALAMADMIRWQNQFDSDILAFAKSDGVPAALVKNTLIRESQLWPGDYSADEEVGLNQLTQNGADTVLLWNPTFYQGFCPLVLDAAVCSQGYANLSKERQRMLQGALLNKIDATCPECENGVNLDKAKYSIHVFSEALKANCNQVNQIIQNVTDKPVRGISTYSDLWRFTLVNYNAGSGCLGSALTKTWQAKSPMDWEHVSANLDPVCQAAIEYVAEISAVESGKPPTTLTPTSD